MLWFSGPRSDTSSGHVLDRLPAQEVELLQHLQRTRPEKTPLLLHQAQTRAPQNLSHRLSSRVTQVRIQMHQEASRLKVLMPPSPSLPASPFGTAGELCDMRGQDHSSQQLAMEASGSWDTHMLKSCQEQGSCSGSLHEHDPCFCDTLEVQMLTIGLNIRA